MIKTKQRKQQFLINFPFIKSLAQSKRGHYQTDSTENNLVKNRYHSNVSLSSTSRCTNLSTGRKKIFYTHLFFQTRNYEINIKENIRTRGNTNNQNIFIGIISCLINMALDAIQGFVTMESSLRKIIQFFDFNLKHKKGMVAVSQNKVVKDEEQ